MSVLRPRTAAFVTAVAAGWCGLALPLVPARLTAQQPATPASWAGSDAGAEAQPEGVALQWRNIRVKAD